MPRFVILQHDHPRGRHYDLMLEADGVLKTWAIADLPTIDVEHAAQLLPDHRLAYLDYEGPVSADRGTVKQWDRGVYRLIEQTADTVSVELEGNKIHGKVLLKVASHDQREFDDQPARRRI
jgi:hypothetical protein